MPNYRLLCLNGLERTMKVDEFRAKDDEEAITIARSMDLSFDRQLWKRDRLIAKLPALERTEDTD